METKRFEFSASESKGFSVLVNKAKHGDKKSMEEILDMFKGEIEYLSQFIKLPEEEAHQALQAELINIIFYQL